MLGDLEGVAPFSEAQFPHLYIGSNLISTWSCAVRGTSYHASAWPTPIEGLSGAFCVLDTVWELRTGKALAFMEVTSRSGSWQCARQGREPVMGAHNDTGVREAGSSFLFIVGWTEKASLWGTKAH